MSLKFAIPSSGALHQGALDFMSMCGMEVKRLSARRYTGIIPLLNDEVEVLFQRQSDITSGLEQANLDAGIVGLDSYYETRIEHGNVSVALKDAGFGNSRLTIAVPNSWDDVTSIKDLAEVALEFRNNKGRVLRVATKYLRLVKRFLEKHGITHVSLIKINGALEIAPLLGYADVIADVVDTGTTLKENSLKTIEDGDVIKSNAIIAVNVAQMAGDSSKLSTIRKMLEQSEAALNARNFVRLYANVYLDTTLSINANIQHIKQKFKQSNYKNFIMHKIEGASSMFEVQMNVPKNSIPDTVARFRTEPYKSDSISMQDIRFLFHSECESVNLLMQEIKAFESK